MTEPEPTASASAGHTRATGHAARTASGVPTGPAVPTAAMLLIGNELLSGRTQDANLAHVGQALAARGIRLQEARVVADIEDVIVEAVNSLRQRYTYVFTSGGIGPTHDDITADCIARAFNVPIGIHAEAEQRLLAFWAERDLTPNPARLRMARVPEGGSLLTNDLSAAPGFRVDNVYVMAGVPSIMQNMFSHILPTLAEGPRVLSVSVVCNLGEGTLATSLGELQARFAQLDLGSYPGNYSGGKRVTSRVALVARGTDATMLEAVGEALVEMVRELGGEVLEQQGIGD